MAVEASTSNGSRRYVIAAIIAAIAAFYSYKHNTSNSEERRIENVLAGLLLEERSVNMSTDLPIAVGFGSCLDLLVDGKPLMDALGLKPPAVPKYHETIKTLDDVAEMFALFFSNGAAAE